MDQVADEFRGRMDFTRFRSDESATISDDRAICRQQLFEVSRIPEDNDVRRHEANGESYQVGTMKNNFIYVNLFSAI